MRARYKAAMTSGIVEAARRRTLSSFFSLSSHRPANAVAAGKAGRIYGISLDRDSEKKRTVTTIQAMANKSASVSAAGFARFRKEDTARPKTPNQGKNPAK